MLTAGTSTGKSTVLVEPGVPESGYSFMYQTGEKTDLDTVAYNTAITSGNWTALTASGTEITPSTGDTHVAVVEVGADGKPIAYGVTELNIG